MGRHNQANEINMRERLKWAAYSKFEFAFDMKINAEQKARIHDQCIYAYVPVLTYGAETWVFAKEIHHKLQVAQRKNGKKTGTNYLRWDIEKNQMRQRTT